jgi:uncharacterized repeat protein (TIGR01451 family)
VQLTDAVPSGTTFVSFTSAAGFTATTPTAGGTGTVTATDATLAAGASATFTLVVKVKSSVPASSTLSNSATVSSTTADPNAANNSANATSTVTTLADLAVTLSNTPNPATAGSQLTYTVSVSDAGPSDATGVSLSDGLPAKANFGSATPDQGTVSRAGGVFSWNVGTLAAGGSATLTIVVVPYAAGTATSTATVQGMPPDPHLGNNTATLTTLVRPFPALIITGADAGGSRTGPDVMVRDAATGVERFRFLAFRRRYHGGVRVALGDVNRDGVPDILVGSGPGLGSRVRVFDGRTGAQLPGPLGNFKAFPGFQGGVYVAAGDVIGDGFADVIVAQGAGGKSRVKVFSGANGALLESFRAYGGGFTGGVRVAAGDVNGDGIADIVVAPGGPGARAVKVFNGQTEAVLSHMTPFPRPVAGGLFVAAGDVNGDGDGHADIVVGQGQGGSSQVVVLDGATGASLGRFTPFPTGFTGGVRVGLADVNGDGRQDLLLGAGPSTAPGSAKVGPLVSVFDALTGQSLGQFFAYAMDFHGGLFVGGSH